MTTQKDATTDDLGLDLLSEDERNNLLSDIGEIIFTGALQKAWQSLAIKEQDALTALFEASNADPESEEKRNAIDKFLSENVPDFEQYVEKEAEAFMKTQQQIFGELTS